MPGFQHIEYLLALAALAPMWGLYLYLVKWKKNRIKKIGDPPLVALLVKSFSPRKFLLKFILFSVAYALTVIGLANPRSPRGSVNVKRNGIDVVIALDVSKSMLAEDIKPNRLERAKQFASRMIDKLADDRVGIVVFAGRAYLQMPLTADHAAAKMYLASAAPDVVPTQGTMIGDALKMCYSAFNNKEKKYRSIVLISDGEDHDKDADKITVALANEGVMVNTVGIGSPEGITIQDVTTGSIKMDNTGKPVVTKLNEASLQSIAAKGNGIYRLFTNADEVADAIEEQLKTMEQHSVTETSRMNYENFFPWFLLAAFILLVAEFFISEKRAAHALKEPVGKKGSPGKMNTAAVLSFCCIFFIPVTLFSQNGNSLIKKGNEEYNSGRYNAAIENYYKALKKNAANQTARFNLGNALYKNGNTDEALEAYDHAIKGNSSASDISDAWYNKAVVLQNDKKLDECIEAYKNALKLNPADEDARLNLQKALKQQQKEQPKEKKEEKKKEDKQQQKQQPQQQPPKPQQPKMTRKEAEEKLKALLQKEKNLQEKFKRVGASSPEKPEKDW